MAYHPWHAKENNTEAPYAYDNVVSESHFHYCASQGHVPHPSVLKFLTWVYVRRRVHVREHNTVARYACGNVADDEQPLMECSRHLRRDRRAAPGTEQAGQHGRAGTWKAWQ